MTEPSRGQAEDREPQRLDPRTLRRELASLPAWRLSADGSRITRHYCFADYRETIEFVLKAARVAHRHGHYPTMHVGAACVDMDLTTPELGGVSDNDVALAAHMDTCHFVHLATLKQQVAVDYPVGGGGCGGGCGDGCGSPADS